MVFAAILLLKQSCERSEEEEFSSKVTANVRNILHLVILAFVFFLQGLAPKVRTVREGQLQQAPPTPCPESWMATATVLRTGLLGCRGMPHGAKRCGRGSAQIRKSEMVEM